MEETVAEPVKWSPLKRFLFLFFLFYSFFYIFPFPLTILSYSNYKITDGLSMLIGEHLLHIPNLTIIYKTGSGDTTFDYVRIFTFLVLSLILSIIVFIIDRKRANYFKLFYLLYVSVRFYLAFVLLSYGFSKVFKTQFHSLQLPMLEEPFGNSSPMGLLWKFMGYSTVYCVFAGMCEVIPGILLLFKRTEILGALVSLFVMINVVALNFCYNVPVKLYSSHLVLFSLFILLPNSKNLLSFFILGKNSKIENYVIPFTANWIKVTQIGIKVLILCLVFLLGIKSYVRMKQYGDSAQKPPLAGIYNVQLFVRNHDTLKSNSVDTVRWEKLFIDKFSSIELANKRQLVILFVSDTVSKTIEITTENNMSFPYNFTYKLKTDTLILYGQWRYDSLYIKLKKVPDDFLLDNSGFHWINEYPSRIIGK